MTVAPNAGETQIMTVREVLKLPSMEGATIIAGGAGLGRNVTNAMVLEGPDVEKWGKPGLLLVTSFYALEPLDTSERVEFFNKLGRIGIGGIVFKPERLLKAVPESYLQACDESAIPLVRIRPDVKYEAVLMDVMGNAIDSNVTLLNTFFEVHRQTMKLALEQPSIHTILGRIKASLNADVTFYNRTDDVRVGTDAAVKGFSTLRLTELERSHYQTFHYFEALLDYPSHATTVALAVLVPGSETHASYLVVHRDIPSITPVEYMTIENYASLLQTELLKQAAIEQHLFSRNNMTVHDLLLNRFSSHADVAEALKMLGIDVHPLYQTMLLRITITDPSQADRFADLLATFTRRLKRVYYNVVFFENNNRTVYLRNFSSVSLGFNQDAVEAILTEMHADEELPPFVHLVAISDTCDRYSLATINEQVMGMYRLFDPNRTNNRCMSYEDLGVYKLFLGVSDLSHIDDLVDPRLVRLQNESPEGYKTLITLAEHNFSFGDAAEELFVHPKTIHYRVNRIRESYGIDLSDSNDLVQVLLASKVINLLGPE